MTKEDKIHDVPSFLKAIYDLGDNIGVRCYRGEANNSWKMKPSVMRKLQPDAERMVIQELLLEVADEFSADRSMFAKLVRAQHYGLPTRLLDVTLNPLVALFFACYDEKEKDRDGHVIVLDFEDTRVKFADSDTISVLSNLANMKDSEILAIEEEIIQAAKNRTSSDKRDTYINSMPEARRLIHFIRSEKPYFAERINFSDLKKYFFVHPQKNNRRIVAQSGAFVIAGTLKYPGNGNIQSFRKRTITIPQGSKGDILRNLDLININPRSLHPEIEFASRYIKDRWTKPER